MAETNDVPGPHHPSAHATRRELISASLRAAPHGAVDAAGLRDAVCEYVDIARQRGEPVERVIVDLKQELRAAGAIDRYAHPKERELAESVIRWCIERYYGAAGG